MSEIDEMLTRIERAIEHYEKHTDDIGMPIFLRDIAKVVTMLRIAEQGAGSMLLDLQQDCIKERQRAEAAENELACKQLLLVDAQKWIDHHFAQTEAAEKRLSALEEALQYVGFRVTYLTVDDGDNIAASLDALEAKT